MKTGELSWIDGFVKRIKPHIHLRSEDGILILPPNKVYKVNESAYGILSSLLNGKKIRQLKMIHDGERASQVHWFFCDLKSFYQGCGGNIDLRRATDRVQFGFDFTRLPILGEIALTYRCNNFCRFCYAKCGSNTKTGEMTTVDVKRIITIFKEKAKIPFFSFTGGEPLLRTDLEELIRFARKKKLSVNLITNGTLIDGARARSLKKSGLGSAQVSVESAEKELHDFLTGAEGSYEKTLAGIRNLQAAGIPVQTNTTLSQPNVPGIDAFPEFLATLGIKRFAMNLFIPSGRGLTNENLFFPYSRIGNVVESVRKKAESLNLTFFWYSPTPHCHYNPIARGLGNKSCAAMDGLISVSPEGNVLPCSSYPESLGNLLNNDFNAIWFSSRAAYFKTKKYAPSECDGCTQFTACQAACPLYWQYAGTDEIKCIKGTHKEKSSA
ncbi:MAG: radical SAM protein [Spirochaetales bacterium]|nr:radical SAM protein [Spirochaetales bacterium]